MKGGAPELIVLPSVQAVAELAADRVEAAIHRGLSTTGRADIALTGGRTPGLLYDVLTLRAIDWTGVHLWIGDERLVSYSDPESNVLLVRERLGSPGAVLHLPPESGDAETRALAYSFQLKEKVLDLILLGLGEDAHTASLFPDNPAIDDERTVVPVHGSPKPPPDRISFGLGVLSASPARLMLVTGEGKREALQKALGEPTKSVPSSLLPAAGTTILADPAAAHHG
jgi:6-phosphogluconolactonase